MGYKIRDWNLHFERDRSAQWKHLSWVPIPNKQGHGYRKIMSEKNGTSIFGCWHALVQQASLCTPRGDLSKYTLEDLSLLTLIKEETLSSAIDYLSKNLDWIEVTDNLDTNVLKIDINGKPKPSDGSILSNTILSFNNRVEAFKEELKNTINYPDTMKKEFFDYWTEPNKSKTKMRFELEKTWDLNRRLNTWASRDRNFNKKPVLPERRLKV